MESDETKRWRIENTQKAKRIRQELETLTDVRARLSLLRDLGFNLLYANKPDEAEAAFQERLDILNSNSELVSSKDLALAWRDVANAQQGTGRLADAEKNYKRGLDLCGGNAEDLGEVDTTAQIILMELADNLAMQGKYAEAEELYQAELNLQKMVVSHLRNLGSSDPLRGARGPLEQMVHRNIADYTVKVARMMFLQGKSVAAQDLLVREMPPLDEAQSDTLSDAIRAYLLDALKEIEAGRAPEKRSMYEVGGPDKQ